jgi:precorrin-8X/cobalt-precorrin-8 methylmutase
MAGLMRFCHNPVDAGIRAIEAGSLIITDIRMVQVGIQKRGHHCPIVCALDHAGPDTGITRSSSGLIALREKVPGSVLIIGNAPSALLTACAMILDGVCPALVIGTPVGFVNAAESKEMLRKQDIPSVSTEGTRGGTPVAVASINEIITMVAERAAGTGEDRR